MKMKFYETVEIDIEAEDLMDKIFEENPGFVIDWIRENIDKIVGWKQCNEKYNNFLRDLRNIRVGNEEI
jgi:hypothetical protein